jgi:hypothetical protein
MMRLARSPSATGMEHSPTSETGTGWERTPWHATQRAAWDDVRPVAPRPYSATRHCKTPRREDATLTAGFDPRRTYRPR